MAGINISVCIIAKNEEKYIEECLKRLLPYGFEIVVCDTGSTDRTRDIACRYADKVIDFEWIKDFAAARNYCADHAANDWILALDCDEYVESFDAKETKELMLQYPDLSGLMVMYNINADEGEDLGYTLCRIPRLYDRRLFTFKKPIHEQIVPIDNRNHENKFFELPMKVIHHGYAVKGDDMKKKQERNLEILLSGIEKEPENAYYYFQAGNSLAILNQNERAIQMYEKCILLDDDVSRDYVSEAVISLAHILSVSGANDEAIRVMERFVNRCRAAKFYYVYGNILYQNNQPLKAVVNYIKATIMPDANLLGENLLICYERIIFIYQKTGNYDLAKPFEQKYLECRAEREQILRGSQIPNNQD